MLVKSLDAFCEGEPEDLDPCGLNRRDFMVRMLACVFGVLFGPEAARAILEAPRPVQDALIRKNKILKVWLNGQLQQEGLDYVESADGALNMIWNTAPGDQLKLAYLDDDGNPYVKWGDL